MVGDDDRIDAGIGRDLGILPGQDALEHHLILVTSRSRLM